MSAFRLADYDVKATSWGQIVVSLECQTCRYSQMEDWYDDSTPTLADLVRSAQQHHEAHHREPHLNGDNG